MKMFYDLKTSSSNALIKFGAILILIGLLILFLKELIIMILASIFIGLGIFLIALSFKFR